ncbi:MAG: hypothetical protein AAF492_29155, partial [Verrucomicrobiota bacterium]
MLNGNLVSGAPADVTIYWGDNDGGTTFAQWDNAIVFPGQGVGAISSTVTGLTYGVEYYYRLYMTNAVGDAWAAASTNFKSLNPLVTESTMAWLYSTQRSDGSSILNPDGTAVSLDWNVHKLNPTRFSHNGGTPDELTVVNAGDYFVAFTLPMTNSNTTVDNRRSCIRAQLFVNGVSRA